ncbi:hypothetical protein Axi01nite_72250 [Actinoplanes xinjiangensis]|nr:hypothetical protein Axi01nite_72250 [Actinoplanes xinjiangensis]
MQVGRSGENRLHREFSQRGIQRRIEYRDSADKVQISAPDKKEAADRSAPCPGARVLTFSRVGAARRSESGDYGPTKAVALRAALGSGWRILQYLPDLVSRSFPESSVNAAAGKPEARA